MNINLRTACFAATIILSSTAMAAAQNATDSRGNANGSEHVGNGGGAMQGTTGMTSGGASQSARDNPNGSAGAPPKAHAGPQGDPSKTEDGKR